MAGISVTLIVWTTLTDPIGLPKMFVLALFSAWIFGTIGVLFLKARAREVVPIQWALFAFSLAVFIAAILTDVRYTAFYGAGQRNNGAITYFSFAILMLAATLSFNRASVSRFRTAFIIVGAITTIYGLLQISNHDPFNWILLYGPVVGTLGNPDFMSALLGTVGIATVWFIVSSNRSSYRLMGGGLLLLELFVIKRSGSFQGILAFAIGLVLIVLGKLWQISRRVGLISTAIVGIFSIPVLLGLTNNGPLASHLYRSSLQNRLDYWRAAICMFKAHPIFGVGLDRFAENYANYAPKNQVVFGQLTDNAHNVFLQLLATGGLLVFLPYMAIIILIFLKSIQGIRKSHGQTQIDLVGLFAIWFALLLISSISIDNLGVAVWFWISGGVLFAVGQDSLVLGKDANINEKKKKKSRSKSVTPSENYISPIMSLILSVAVLLVVIPTVRTSGAIADMQANRSGLTTTQFLAKIDSTANIWPRNSQTLNLLGDIALRINNIKLGLILAGQAIEIDPKSNYGNQLSAIAYERSKNYAKAIAFRKRVIELDPWNTSNMLEIVKDYLFLKDIPNAKAMVEKITQLRPDGSEDVAAAALLKG